MKYDLSNHWQEKQAIAKFKQLLQDKKKIELKPLRMKRTLKQNAYLHVCITLFAIEVGLSLEEAKTFLKRECQFMTYIKETKSGKEVKFLKSTAQLNTSEMSTFIDWIKTYAGVQGIYIPESNQEYLDNQFDIDRHIETYREYL